MTVPVLIRSGLIGATVAAAIVGTAGFSNIGLGAALVGETHRILVSDSSGSDLDGLKSGYRRPAFDRPSRSDLIGPLSLGAEEKSDLVAFLKALTGSLNSTTMPTLPRRVYPPR
jgi:hypothetical protein